MPQTHKVLGQSKPAATTLTTAYTVPASTSTIVSTVTIANQSATPTTFRISVAIAGAADTPAQYIAYDTPINANDVVTLTLGISLAATDLIRVYNTLATCSFNLFGVELT
jgi:uncharacterized lipoprotein YbaY